MNTKELKTRDQIDSKYKWNIEAMIPDESVISGELETIKKEAEAYGEDFAGRLTESADTLLAAFQKRDDIWRRLEKIYVYARMRRDENNAETKYQAMTDQCDRRRIGFHGLLHARAAVRIRRNYPRVYRCDARAGNLPVRHLRYYAAESTHPDSGRRKHPGSDE